ncbi:MAG: tetratricopeptide repeat protein [Methylovulum miyakonense]|uniref:tetratricopeptide repeat protein n=1 Tax=Methylovulum miyakonense TaxID=645578 RepID=UPI003BB71A06
MLAPDQAQAYQEAGIECKDLGLFSEAESFFDNALVCAPNDFITRTHRAICNRLQKKHDLCLQQLMELVDNKIENGWIYSELAITLKELGRFEEAEQWFRQALAKNPADISFLWEFALSARMAGNKELALAQFETICQYNPFHIGAHIEATAELSALGRQLDAANKLHVGFVQTQNPFLLDKYLLLLFGQKTPIAVHELCIHAAHYPITVNVMQRFFDYSLACPQNIGQLMRIPKPLILTLANHDSFATRLMFVKNNNINAFNALLAYFKPVFLLLIEHSFQPLLNNNLFILLILFSKQTKHNDVSAYVLGHVEQYFAQFSFSELCKATSPLVGLTSENFVLSLFSKVARERHAVNCLLASLIMRGYYPQEPCLTVLDDKKMLLKLLPHFCAPENEAVLKNIFTHFLQQELLTLAEINTLYPKRKFIKSLEAVDKALKPLLQANHQGHGKSKKLNMALSLSGQFRGYKEALTKTFYPDNPIKPNPPVDKPIQPVFNKNRLDQPPPPKKNLNVALCISGQLRGYKEAFSAIKKSIVEPLRPDIFVHTWQDVGFKIPYPGINALRVFQGNFLRAYQDFLLGNPYSYDDIKKILPAVFSLFDENTSVTAQQLKEFYQTDSVVVEDDQASPYASFNNQQKMRHKIAACNQLAQEHGQATGKQYDLVIRLRPDLEFHAVDTTNWVQIAEICNSEKIIFLDWSSGLRNLTEGGAYGTGDVVAIGSPSSMEYYSSMSKLKDIFVEHGLEHFSADMTHSLLAHSLWVGGYTTRILPLEKGRFISTSLKAEKVLKAIQNDVSNLDKKVADSLVNALRQDIINE